MVTHLLVLTHGNQAGEIDGGLLFEYFPGSGCGLLEYLVVAPESRGKGVARRLVDAAKSTLAGDARAAGGVLKAVFAEVERPDFSPPDGAFPPGQRWRFFTRIGARLVDIPYVQPALSPDSSRAYHLRLLAFPEERAGTLDRNVILAFLAEYYRALEVDNPAHDPDWQRMAAAMPATVPLISLGEASWHAR